MKYKLNEKSEVSCLKYVFDLAEKNGLDNAFGLAYSDKVIILFIINPKFSKKITKEYFEHFVISNLFDKVEDMYSIGHYNKYTNNIYLCISMIIEDILQEYIEYDSIDFMYK